MNIFSAINRYPLITFFVIAYALSWGSYYALSGPFLFPFGAIIAALVVAAMTNGGSGLKDILFRCLRWRVGLIWYLAALGVPTGMALASIGANIMLGSPAPAAVTVGNWYDVFLLFPIAMIDAPLWEESAWRGFAMPRFSADRSRLFNSLILGLLLAGWHLPIALGAGAIAAPYLVACVGSAIVTNWVYFGAKESALLAIVYHTAANTMGIYLFQSYTGVDQHRAYWLMAAFNWIVAILIICLSPAFRKSASNEIED